MAEIARIKEPVADEMKRFEQHFRQAMKSKVPLLDTITHYIIKRKGKQMRPLFVFLSAKTAGGVTESSYHAASLIELLHTATLVHDDVVDDANRRRGFFSLNALWKNKIAVLVGDYLLSRGLLLAVDKGEFELLRIVSQAVREMSEGELQQFEKSRMLDITEPVYFEVIRKKTASLISACCAAGAASAGAPKEVIDLMHTFGEKTGIAFQIKDDLFDYGSSDGIGKPTGIDIRDRKLTLPLIHAMKGATPAEKKHIIKLLRTRNEERSTVLEITDFVRTRGGIDYSRQRMHELVEEALALLNQFPPSEARTELHHLVEYTISRTK